MDILGTPSMGKAMEPWRRWMIIGIGGETNGWALDTPQLASVQEISWLVRAYRVQWRTKGQTQKRLADGREQGVEGI